MDRRSFLITGAGALGLVGLGGVLKTTGALSGTTAAAAESSVLKAGDVQLAVGTPYPLVALPGKAPMGQVYDRPPNYETPADRLIGQKNYPYTDNAYYYVRYREAVPLDVNPDIYRLKIGGDAADNEITLTYDELKRRVSTTIGAVGMCSGEGRGLHHPMIPGMPWTKGDLSCAEWTGVRLVDLLEEVGVKANALHVSFGAGRIISLTKPQYWRSYPIESVRQKDVLIATQMNGEDIPFWNGYPARLVVPGTWAPTWTKQVIEIQVRTTPQPMEWSGRKITPNKLAPFSLVVTPTDGTKVPLGRTVELTGIAFDAGVGIATVEYSMDDGKTWKPTTLERSYGQYTWRVWRANVAFETEGTATVITRSTTTDGKVQQMDPTADAMKNSARKELASRTFAAYLNVVRA